MSFLIMAEDGESVSWPADALKTGAGQLTDTGAVQIFDRPGEPYDVILDLAPTDGPGWQLLRDSEGMCLATDGTLQQAAVAAAWARSLLPDDVPCEVWLIDQAYTHRAVLTAGIDAQAVADHFHAMT